MTPTVAVPPPGEVVPIRRRRGRLLALALAAVAATAAWSLRELSDDLPGMAVGLSGAAGAVPWPSVPVLLLLATVHYGCAAVALEAASGHRLRLAETVMAQTAAAAVSRVVPAGVGGLAVNVRYLTRCGATTPQALTAVGLVRLVGCLCHALLIALIALLIPGAAADLRGITHAGPSRHLLLLLAAALALVVALGWTARALAGRTGSAGSRTGRRWRAAAAGCGAAWEALRTVMRDRRALVRLVAGTVGTPVVLACAFAVSMVAVPDGPPASRVGVLLLAYLTGSAVGASVPLPSGVGATEAALTAVSVAAGVPALAALQGVLLFRAVTFWCPVPVGLWSARRLRKAGLL